MTLPRFRFRLLVCFLMILLISLSTPKKRVTRPLETSTRVLYCCSIQRSYPCSLPRPVPSLFNSVRDMEDDRRGSTHPEREFQSMGLPLSFGNSNSRQARAAFASRRPLDSASQTSCAVHRPPPPPPPSQLFNQPTAQSMRVHSHSDPHFHQQQRSVCDRQMQPTFPTPPPPPATIHVQSSFHQHQSRPIPPSHLRAKPYGSSADSSRRKHGTVDGHQTVAGGPSMNPQYLFKDSMFGNPWRSCVQASLRSV